ncbi:hypothetical protein BGW38_004148 [Lunasporangiospora selenospora]|uniref:Tfp pilus assembly protein PilF n=1 Tax=Lunasporangiospora selenospora TaxID=979761 RepID=A0A9P6KCC4_9FUNG|nr:hypothetical protein BGW38_004148 [Lunasporangiospora selenospora]
MAVNGPGSGPVGPVGSGPVPGPSAGPVPGPNPVPVPAGAGPASIVNSPAQRLDAIDEQVWLQLGSLAESMGEYDRAMAAYESALRHNFHSVNAMNLIAELYRSRENFQKAAEYFQRILAIDNANGEVWGSLGHCYLMMEELHKAYNAYQNALHHLPNPKDSKLWYGIGILYDRYGSVEHAEEAFTAVMRMDPKYEKANEIYFRLGIIYKGQQKYAQSLECFRYILHSPPRPLTEADIWFQIGHVHEQQKDASYTSAKEAYERVLSENPNHAKVLQQLGWLYHQQNASFMNQDLAIKFLTRSIESDNTDAQSWYLMGRCYMAQQKFNKAYEAYQQAVYRDSRNPTFWCSIGLLYFQINQYRDALDAYSKAIRINPNISEVWYDLGTLYESCNNQISDAIDAYQRASDLDPENVHIKQRLAYLRQNNGAQGSVPPPPEEMNPNNYPPGGANGQHPFGQNAPMNGEHQQPGRDLPLPGNGSGGNGAPGGGLPGAGRGSGSPGSYMNEERPPHIPGINPGGPRPPTPASSMPQMMTNERGHGPTPPASASAHSGARSGHGRRLSPGPEGPYGRPGSPGMQHPSGPHGDPHYPQHGYGHGPPPPHGMPHEGHPQGYDRQDEGARMKQDDPRYQHHRHRSGDMRMGMEEDPMAPGGQRPHPSDPHGRPSSPSRDDRRPMNAPPGHGQYGHPPPPPPQQQQQHPSDGRWMSPSGQHGPMSEDQGRDARHAGQVPPPDHLPPRNAPGPDNYGPRHQGSPRPGSEQERGEQRSMEHHSPLLHRSSPEQSMRDSRMRPMHEETHPDRNAGYDMGGEPGRNASGWSGQENRHGGYRTEEQDKDEIAASLVSLSGKGPSRGGPVGSGGRGGQDEDYDMEGAEPSGHNSAPAPAPPTSRDAQERPPSRTSYDGHYRAEGREQEPSAPQTRVDQLMKERPSRQSSPAPAAVPSTTVSAPDSGANVSPPVGSGVGSGSGTGPSEVSSENAEASDARAEDAEARKSPSTETMQPPLSAGSQQGGPLSEKAPSRGATPATASAPSSVKANEGPSAAAEAAPAKASEDEDTEMEEGEVREDEDDEIMSSGAVPSTTSLREKEDGSQ